MKKLGAVCGLALAVAACTNGSPLAPPSDLTPPPSAARKVTKGDVEKADAAVRAAAVHLRNMCPADGLGDPTMCPLDDRPDTPKSDLAGARAECLKVVEEYNRLVEQGVITGEVIKPGTKCNP